MLSFNIAELTKTGGILRLNPSFVTTLAKAICIVCSNEWAGNENVLNGIVRTDGTVIGADEAHEIMAAPSVPLA